MAISIQNLLRDGRVDKDATQDIYHLDEAKAPDIITAIKSGDVLLADGHIYVLISIDGTREIVIGNSSDTYDSAFKIAGTSGEPVVVTWEEIDGKPETFPPSAHTHNATDINAGVLNIARIPTGTTATTVALGNHTQAFTTITGVATAAQIPSLPTSKITNLDTTLTSKANTADLGDLALKDKVAIGDIDATGTPSATTYLRGDGSYATPANTTYTLMSQAEADAGTVTTGRTINALVLDTKIKTYVPVAIPALGTAGQVLAVNATGDGLEWITLA